MTKPKKVEKKVIEYPEHHDVLCEFHSELRPKGYKMKGKPRLRFRLRDFRLVYRLVAYIP